MVPSEHVVENRAAAGYNLYRVSCARRCVPEVRGVQQASSEIFFCPAFTSPLPTSMHVKPYDDQWAVADTQRTVWFSRRGQHQHARTPHPDTVGKRWVLPSRITHAPNSFTHPFASRQSRWRPSSHSAGVRTARRSCRWPQSRRSRPTRRTTARTRGLRRPRAAQCGSPWLAGTTRLQRARNARATASPSRKRPWPGRACG